ncbi:MAG: type I glutamate--ammonia ligase [Myxococcales bacterium]|nr:type I glutamate--ammonia ligase [Myxococcales bacterium]
MTPAEVLSYGREHSVEMFDIKFVDLFGSWQHFTLPTNQISEQTFEDGLGFDGSSVRGWQAVHASDMLVIPDPTTVVLDPIMNSVPTLSMLGHIFDPITRESYSRDPRYVAQKAATYLESTGVGDVAYFGPEPEFFIFDDLRFESTPGGAFYRIDSAEGGWSQTAYRTRNKGGYFSVGPTDSIYPVRLDIVQELQRIGITVERDHHEVAAAGQCEIDFRYRPLVESADAMMWLKYIVRNVAARHGRVATFMPKPIFADHGSGMHTHQSIWKKEKPLFAGDGYAGMSDLGMHYIAGILRHAPALCAFTNPATNSYKRLVPGFEAPVSLAYSSRNRSASIRIPMYSSSPKSKRIEVRFPDAVANPYLAFSAMLMAGLDGIMNRMDPGDPLDKDIYGLTPEELSDVSMCPGSLEEALDALEQDHTFLLKGDVFSVDLVETWISFKREHEVDLLRQRPHPVEFELYHDA